MIGVLPVAGSGGLPGLGELPEPRPAPGEALVEVRATAVNWADLLLPDLGGGLTEGRATLAVVPGQSSSSAHRRCPAGRRVVAMSFPPYEQYPPAIAEDIVRLRRRIASPAPPRIGVPAKVTDRNLLVATWNLQAFGRIFESFDENPGSPKRNLRGLAYIAEVVRRFDVVAIQEVKRQTVAIRLLIDRFLGPDWGLLLSDVTAGTLGNSERLAFVWDKRRVEPTGLAGEIVLPPEAGSPAEQFDRTPYIVGFRSRDQRFALLTAHIRFGDAPEERVGELESIARFTAREIRDRATDPDAEERNLIILGDFNIDRRGDNPLFQAFVETGLVVPRQLHDLKTTAGREPKFYDQIAWFMGALELDFNDRAGVIDFVGAVYRDLTSRQLPSRVSDHFPLWVEFVIDRSNQQIAGTLGLDAAAPDPFGAIPD